jgi:hypothetical protein
VHACACAKIELKPGLSVRCNREVSARGCCAPHLGALIGWRVWSKAQGARILYDGVAEHTQIEIGGSSGMDANLPGSQEEAAALQFCRPAGFVI